MTKARGTEAEPCDSINRSRAAQAAESEQKPCRAIISTEAEPRKRPNQGVE